MIHLIYSTFPVNAHLEVWTADTLGELVEEGNHHLQCNCDYPVKTFSKSDNTFWNSAGSMTSNISSSSLRNITSLGLWTLGQYLSEYGDEQVFRRDNISLKTYLNKDIITGSVRLGSFSRNWTTQYASCGWYTDRDRTLWRGSRTWKWEM